MRFPIIFLIETHEDMHSNYVELRVILEFYSYLRTCILVPIRLEINKVLNVILYCSGLISVTFRKILNQQQSHVVQCS